MKLNRLLAPAALSALLIAPAAHAAQVDISGTGNMGVVPVGNFGNISSDSTPVNSVGTAYDPTNGYLTPGESILFTYTSSTAPLSSFGSAYVVATGQYVSTATQYQIVSANGVNTALGGTAPFAQAVNPATLPVILTSNLTAGSKTATTTITNLSSSVVNFTSYFMSSIAGLGGLTATYNVSEVPLPASAMLFMFSLAGLAGFGAYRKSRSKI